MLYLLYNRKVSKQIFVDHVEVIQKDYKRKYIHTLINYGESVGNTCDLISISYDGYYLVLQKFTSDDCITLKICKYNTTVTVEDSYFDEIETVYMDFEYPTIDKVRKILKKFF